MTTLHILSLLQAIGLLGLIGFGIPFGIYIRRAKKARRADEDAEEELRKAQLHTEDV